MGLYKWFTGCLWWDYLRVSSVMLYQGIIPGWVVVLCTWIKKQNGLFAFGLERSMTATEWNEGPLCATHILIGKSVGKNCPLRLWLWMKCCQTWSSKQYVFLGAAGSRGKVDDMMHLSKTACDGSQSPVELCPILHFYPHLCEDQAQNCPPILRAGKRHMVITSTKYPQPL